MVSAAPQPIKVFLSGMEPNIAEALAKLLQEELNKIKKPLDTASLLPANNELSKKRKIEQMSNPAI